MTVDKAYELISNAFAGGRNAHGYLIVGPPRGSGAQLVERLLQWMYCRQSPRGCGKCADCRRVNEHAVPDLHWIEPQMKSRQISINDMRELENEVYQTAYSGGWKAAVIVAADRLTMQASNAFLKTLEEPPGQCVFFLVTDNPDALLPTVRSRCQTVMLDQSTGADLSDEIQSVVIDAMREFRPGNVVSAMLAADRLTAFLAEKKQEIEKLITKESKDAGEELDDKTLDARISSIYRETRHMLMKGLELWFRDVMIMCKGFDASAGIYYREAGDILGGSCPAGGWAAAMANLQIITDINRQLDRNMPDAFVFQNGLVQMK